MKKELGIVLQNEITIYLFRWLPMCIILTNKNLLPYYYQHFIQICSQTNSNQYIMFDYAEGFVHVDVLSNQQIGIEVLEKISDIVGFVIDKINDQMYVRIYLDEYFFPEKLSFQKKHFVHDSLVYGYDDFTKQFFVIGFNENISLVKMSIDFTAFVKAFNGTIEHYQESAPNVKEEGIELIGYPNLESEYPFDINQFIIDVNNYIHGVGRNYIITHIMPPKGEYKPEKFSVKYGIEVYDDVIFGLNKLLEGEKLIDFRAFHLLEENSKGIFRRLSYISMKYNLSNEFKVMIQDYLNICENLTILKLKFIKQDKISKDNSKRERILKEIISKIEVVRTQSKNLLGNIYYELNKEWGEPLYLNKKG